MNTPIKRSSQLVFFKKSRREYGGDLLKKRKGRTGPRPISTQHSMHFVLRSTQAIGPWSFRRHRAKIEKIIDKFAAKNGVRIKSMANVGNHIHMHLQLTNRHAYRPFIRAITSAIMMAVTGRSRWTCAADSSAELGSKKTSRKFWDQRPFSRIVVGFKATLKLADYIEINRFEGRGYSRYESRFFTEQDKRWPIGGGS